MLRCIHWLRRGLLVLLARVGGLGSSLLLTRVLAGMANSKDTLHILGTLPRGKAGGHRPLRLRSDQQRSGSVMKAVLVSSTSTGCACAKTGTRAGKLLYFMSVKNSPWFTSAPTDAQGPPLPS